MYLRSVVPRLKQIAEDMEAMRKRHLEVVQELEENFQITAMENQVKRCVSVHERECTKICRSSEANSVTLSGMDHAEDQISLPEQVKHSEEVSGPLPGEGGEEEGRVGEES